MQRFLKLLLAAALAAPLAAPSAFAHAFLDHAVPGVGMTVSGPVRELRLCYTQGVVTAFSAVSVASSAGWINSGEQARQRSVGPADCDRPSRTGAGTRQLHGELACAFGRHAYDHGHVPLHGHLKRPPAGLAIQGTPGRHKRVHKNHKP